MSDTSQHPYKIEKNATAARQARTTGVVRWVLIVSTVASIVALFAAYLLT